MQDVFEEEQGNINALKPEIRAMRQEMFKAQKNKDLTVFRDRKIKLDLLLEKEQKIRSNGQEQKFAKRHTPEQIHNFIDLIGYNRREALEITERRIGIT